MLSTFTAGKGSVCQKDWIVIGLILGLDFWYQSQQLHLVSDFVEKSIDSSSKSNLFRRPVEFFWRRRLEDDDAVLEKLRKNSM